MEMAARSDRLEARLTAEQRNQIEKAAAMTGESVSSFVVLAALERAETVFSEHASTLTPSRYFDQLLASLDEADAAPRLARAARAATDAPRIDKQ
jgi:uncharacterized protein (DUF1778 family)